MSDELTPEQAAAKEARETATSSIIDDQNDKKVVVAGPGTGKTFLFGRLFASKEGSNKLTLTFINALVEDLSLELRGISDVKTLHGYALSRFTEGKVKIYPRMPRIIRDDGNVILGEDIDFEGKIHEIDESEGHLEFYKARRQYYDHFGYSDIILGLVRLFQQQPDVIPAYTQIVVDEFQDFNKLEVTLVELLATKSPILIAGDDDQALYDFKRAHPQYIRDLTGPDRPEFSAFDLPFCSRSTKVIVDSVNDIVAEATRLGFLLGRVNKIFDYFPCPDKDKESATEPKLIHKRLEDGQIAWFIADEMDKIAVATRKKFEVLVISPYPIQCQKIGKALVKKGFSAVEFKAKEEESTSYFDGLRLLIRHRIGHPSNLGWRIAAKFRLDDEKFAETLKESTEAAALPFRRLLPKEVKDAIESDVLLLKKIEDKDPVAAGELDALLDNLGMDRFEIATEHLRQELPTKHVAPPRYAGIRRLPIITTTINRSKGLSADYVFFTHFDQRYLPGDGNITDRNICEVLVALTRARKKVWLISTTDNNSEFLGWIRADRIKAE